MTPSSVERDSKLFSVLSGLSKTQRYATITSAMTDWVVVELQETKSSQPTLIDDPAERTDSEDMVREWISDGHRFVSVLDSEYPDSLRAVFNAPPFLFYRGQLKALRSSPDGIAVVGTRNPSEAGESRARAIVDEVCDRGLPVISGLARGIDSVAHTRTLERGGFPVGVIATGIAARYTPASSRELHEEVARHGILFSQFEPHESARKHQFLDRNATMSGIAAAVVIVEATDKSGSQAQARMAREQGRPLILTDHVAESTRWGETLASAGFSNVYVVGSIAEFGRAIDRIELLRDCDVAQEVSRLAEVSL